MCARRGSVCRYHCTFFLRSFHDFHYTPIQLHRETHIAYFDKVYNSASMLKVQRSAHDRIGRCITCSYTRVPNPTGIMVSSDPEYDCTMKTSGV